MNKIGIITNRVLIALSMVGIAHANEGSPEIALERWTGFYAGVDTGLVFNNVTLRSHQIGFTNLSERCNTDSDFSTFFAGIQAGYLYQFSNNLVSGVEANISFNTNQYDILECICSFNPDVSDRFSFRNQREGSLKGRFGRALNWNKGILLPYLTTGVSFANSRLSYKNEGGDHYSQNGTQTGWLLGAGIEWAFRQNWSLRAEYYYVDYGNAIKLTLPSLYGLIDPDGKAHADLGSNNLMVAINYWI